MEVTTTVARKRRAEMRRQIGGFEVITAGRHHRKTHRSLKDDAICQGRFESQTEPRIDYVARFRFRRYTGVVACCKPRPVPITGIIATGTFSSMRIHG